MTNSFLKACALELAAIATTLSLVAVAVGAVASFCFYSVLCMVAIFG